MKVVDEDSAWCALDTITDELAGTLESEDHPAAVHAAFIMGLRAAVAWPEWAMLILKAAYPDGELERQIQETSFLPQVFPVEVDR